MEVSGCECSGTILGPGTGKEVLALELHPMQKALAQEDTLRLVEQTLVTVVNQVLHHPCSSLRILNECVCIQGSPSLTEHV